MRRTNFICTVDGCEKPAKSAQLCAGHYKRKMKHGHPLLGRVTKGGRMEWLKSAVLRETDACIIPDFLAKPNYWQAQVNGEGISAHRWACEFANGPPPDETSYAAHSCGMGHMGCINPKHLRWATPAENAADKWEHGSMYSGSKHHTTKLTDDDVARIRGLAGTMTHREIAEQFGISRSGVGKIVSGKNWKGAGNVSA